MEIKKVKIERIKRRDYNPKSRLRDNLSKPLENSIARIGLMYPVLVSKNMELIDGHRRLQAAVNLGWDEIPVIIGSHDEPIDTIYGEINATSAKLTGNQNLQVWLKNPEAVTRRARRQYDLAEEVFGKVILNQLATTGLSIRILRVSKAVAEYVDQDENNAFLRTVAKWLIRWRNSSVVRAYILMQQPTRPLLNAIKANKPLRAVYK